MVWLTTMPSLGPRRHRAGDHDGVVAASDREDRDGFNRYLHICVLLPTYYSFLVQKIEVDRLLYKTQSQIASVKITVVLRTVCDSLTVSS